MSLHWLPISQLIKARLPSGNLFTSLYLSESVMSHSASFSLPQTLTFLPFFQQASTEGLSGCSSVCSLLRLFAFYMAHSLISLKSLVNSLYQNIADHTIFKRQLPFWFLQLIPFFFLLTPTWGPASAYVSTCTLEYKLCEGKDFCQCCLQNSAWLLKGPNTQLLNE